MSESQEWIVNPEWADAPYEFYFGPSKDIKIGQPPKWDSESLAFDRFKIENGKYVQVPQFVPKPFAAPTPQTASEIDDQLPPSKR